MKKMFLICAMVAALTCFNVISAQATIVLEFNPTDIEVPVGTTFSVDLLADIPVNDAILGWGLDLLYDNTQMSWDLLTIGTYWAPYSLPPAPGMDDGFGGLSIFPVSGTNIHLATFDFHCLDIGFSTLDLAVTAGDFTEGFILPNVGGFANWSCTPINITQTPEPATLFLVGTGLAGLVAARHRKKML